MAKRKRGNAEGSIYKMADGRWRAAVSLGWKIDDNGKKAWKRKVITAATRHEVADQMTATLRDQQRGLNVEPQKQTVGQFLTAWLENTSKPSVRPKTYRSYEQMLRNHSVKDIPPAEWKQKKLDAVPGLNDVPLSKLTLQCLQKYFNDKLEAGSSPALVRYLRTVLRIALNEAVKGDLIVRNVAALATPPKGRSPRSRAVHARAGHPVPQSRTRPQARGTVHLRSCGRAPLWRVQRPPMGRC